MFNAEALAVMQGMMLKILPLYGVMALGFFLGRKRPAAAEPLAYLQIYFIVPIVITSAIANLEFQRSYLLLPLISFLGCTFVGLLFFMLGKRLWKDNTANVFSYASGCANTGYYGIPVALIIFPAPLLGIFMMLVVGYTLFEATIGYYLVARGHFTVGDSLRKLARLQLIYAFTGGAVLSMVGQHVPDFAQDIIRDFRGSYVVIGALMIGLGLSRIKQFSLDWLLLVVTFLFKFAVWPLLALGMIFVDRHYTHLFDDTIHKMAFLLSLMPMPANTIAYALELNVQPEKASTMVFLSTLFGLVYIPLAMMFWGNLTL